MPVFEMSSELPVSAGAAFRWHCQPGAFERLAPPWERVELLSTDGVVDGGLARFRVPLGPFTVLWIAEHGDIVPDRSFRDVQRAGPFAHWEHTHLLEPLGPDRCLLTDRISYRPPLGFAGQLLAGQFIRRTLERTFAYRHRVTEQDLAFHAGLPSGTATRSSTVVRETAVMRIAIAGSTGMVGTELVSFLTTGGHEIVRLVRDGTRPGANSPAGTPAPSGTLAAGAPENAGRTSATLSWDPASGRIDAAGLEHCDAVVHLGGRNIAHGRWTDTVKQEIHDSRVNSTSLLARTLATLKHPPRVFLCASAIGYYGDRGPDLMTEDSPPGTSFLSQTCADWEQATQPAREAGIRVINLRIGVVLSPKGGALKQMLTPFRFGLGGVVGSGNQWMSWIALDDLTRIVLHCLGTDSLSGPVNAVAPQPVTNREFTKTLARVLRRPALLPLPASIVRLVFGEMGEELLLASTRVGTGRLDSSGYRFACPELEGALRHLLGRESS